MREAAGHVGRLRGTGGWTTGAWSIHADGSGGLGPTLAAHNKSGLVTAAEEVAGPPSGVNGSDGTVAGYMARSAG